MKIRPYSEADAGDWDAWVGGAINGTFLHTRRFLSYHGDRFQDVSAVIETATGKLAGVFPAAVSPQDPQLVVSHPGITFGGLVTQGNLRGAGLYEALKELMAFYAAKGFTRLQYKAVPYFYYRRPAEDDLYALFRLEARRYRCDLSATMDLTNRGTPSHGRQLGLKKAQKSGITVRAGTEYFAPFWEILNQNLAHRYGVAPVHSLAEITRLYELFPEQIQCVVGLAGDEVVAGTVLFWSEPTLHTQYIATSLKGRDFSALDVIIEACIAQARARGMRWFDFGSSTEDGGTRLNEGLYDYKTSYGATGAVQEFYELALT